MQTGFPGAPQGGVRARETGLGSASGRAYSLCLECVSPGFVTGQALCKVKVTVPAVNWEKMSSEGAPSPTDPLFWDRRIISVTVGSPEHGLLPVRADSWRKRGPIFLHVSSSIPSQGLAPEGGQRTGSFPWNVSGWGPKREILLWASTRPELLRSWGVFPQWCQWWGSYGLQLTSSC